MTLRPAVLALFALTFALSAEDRDFLTPNEADQIREIQEPNERLTLYLKFARQRLDLIDQLLAKDKPGRSVFIHNYLEDYTHIIESIDSVADDALRHQRNIDPGMLAVINSEHDFLGKLNKIQENEPHDLDRYKFLLGEAIDTTSDSEELSKEDNSKRSNQLATADAKEKQERAGNMTDKEIKERKKDTDAQAPRKLPSLLKPGEKAGTPQN